jgi:acetolactate synthase-1/2/3 large subunit
MRKLTKTPIIFDGRDQSTRKGYSCPSFARLAKAYGIDSCVVADASELDITLSRLKDSKSPLLIELMMEGATECRPRLAFGRKLDEQLPTLE